MNKAFQLIDHTADIGIRAFGRNLPEAFSNAAKGMFSLIIDIRKVHGSTKIEIVVIAEDQSGLLVEWLNELLFWFDSEQMLFKKFIISELGETTLKAECWGEKVDRSRHQLKKGIKAATYHMLKVQKTPKGEYEVDVILDI
jgi:SHS2 domain-containing protein